MTFEELVDEALADDFPGARETSGKRWVNYAYGRLWNADKWVFTEGTDTVTATSGSRALSSLPADLAAVTGLERGTDGYPLRPISYKRLAELYAPPGSATGPPEVYATVDRAVFVGPTPDATDTAMLLIYEKALTLLVGDDDVPDLPEELHLPLVDGAKSRGLRVIDPTMAASYEASFLAAIDTARLKYLRATRDVPARWPSDAR